jgi:hypothetical protein
MKLFRWLLLFALASPLMAQNNTRWDLPVTTVQAQGGNLLPIYAIPGAGVKFYSCSGSTCSTLATTYISATSSTTCPTTPVPMQVTLNGSSTCVSNADPSGNIGGWFQTGQYMALITASGASYSYLFTIGAVNGAVPAGPAYCVQFANSPVTAFQCDSTITINPTTHTQCWGGCPSGNIFSFTGLGPVVSGGWTFNYQSPATAINSMVGPGLIQLVPSSTGSDICGKISSAISILLAGNGGTVDATAFAGTQACSSNPFVPLNSASAPLPITLRLGAGVYIQTTAQWVISEPARIEGPGWGSALIQYTGTSGLLDPYGNPGGVIEWEGTWNGSTCSH